MYLPGHDADNDVVLVDDREVTESHGTEEEVRAFKREAVL